MRTLIIPIPKVILENPCEHYYSKHWAEKWTKISEEYNDKIINEYSCPLCHKITAIIIITISKHP